MIAINEQNIQYVTLWSLQSHPKNSEFFDDMEGEKWNDFLQSIKTSGIIEPIIVTQNMLVVSGHQRLRAARELKLKTVPIIVKNYKNDDDILKDLLETNLRQRGTISTSNFKSANIAKTLERIYKSDGNSNSPKTQKELADKLGISLRSLQYIKSLDKLPNDLKELVEAGKITSTTAIKIFDRLTPEEKSDVIKMIKQEQGKTSSGEITDYIQQIRNKDLEISRLKNELSKINSENNDSKRVLFDKFVRLTTDYMKDIQSISKNSPIDDLLQQGELKETDVKNLQNTILNILDILSEISQKLGEALFEF